MSRSKLLAAVLLGMLLAVSALSESDSLISEDMIAANTVNYKTEKVSIGTYEQIFSNSGSEYYPNSYEVYPELDGARFVEHLVVKGDVVKKGDVLTRLAIECDEVGIAEQRIALENAQSEMEREVKNREDAIDELKEALLSQTDRYDYEILELRIRRAKIELEQYTANQERKIEQLKESIAELEKYKDGYEVLAPADGVVSRVAYLRPDEVVYRNELLVAMYQPEIKLLRLENTANNMAYGMDVTLEIGYGDKARFLTGHVVGSDTLIPESQRSGYAYVAVDADPAAFAQAKTKIAARYLENVMLVPRKAVKMEAGKYYVMKLVDGVAQKRYINCVSKQGDYAWLLQGLELGEDVIVG